MAEDSTRQAVQEAIAESANNQAKLQTIGTACAVAGAICTGLFFIIDSQINKKTSGIRTEIEVIKNQFENQEEKIKTNGQAIKEVHGSIKSVDKKIDELMILMLKNKNSD